MEARVALAERERRRGRAISWGLVGDERLARGVAEGSEAAFTALYRRYHQPLYRYCRSLTGNDTDAQDALQAAMTGALVALRERRRDAPLRPWLFRIAHNESTSLLRRRRPTQQLPEELDALSRSPQEITEDRARLATLVADLRELPDRQRGALLMRELSGLPHEEIAASLGVSVGAAKQTVLEARRSLAEFEQGRDMACAEIERLVSDGDRRAMRSRRVRAHLRSCASCTAFARAIPQRRTDLAALAPALPAGAAAGLLGRITGSGGGHGGGLGAGLAGKAAGATISTKLAAAGAAVVLTAAVGAEAVHQFASAHRALPARVAHSQVHGQTATHAAPGTAAKVIAPSTVRPGSAAGTHRPGIVRAGAGHAARRAAPVAAGTVAGRLARSTVTAGHGRSSSAPGRGGTSPGRVGSAPGRAGTSPGRAGTSPGRAGTSPGRSGSSPGRSGSTRGQSGNAPQNPNSGKPSQPPGQANPHPLHPATPAPRGTGQSK